MKSIFDKCKDCKHSIFNEIWGAYKCNITQTFIYEKPNGDCSDYEKEVKKNE